MKLCGLSRSTFYYKPKIGKQGRRPYAKILDKDGLDLSIDIVLESIIKLFEKPFVDYGYFKTYIYLRDTKKYKISKHTVYKVMKNNKLLRTRYKPSSKKTKKKWVVDLIPKTDGAFSYFEFDIKFVYIQKTNRNAQVLTIIDIETRIVLVQYTAYSIGKKNVIELFDQMINEYQLSTNFTVRSDNGGQFIALDLQEYLDKKGIVQEYTIPATPEQDAHIEAYHSIMESAVCQRFEFDSLKDLKETLQDFKDFYNFERIHSGTAYKSPYLNFMEREDNGKRPLQHVKKILRENSLNYFKKLSDI